MLGGGFSSFQGGFGIWRGARSAPEMKKPVFKLVDTLIRAVDKAEYKPFGGHIPSKQAAVTLISLVVHVMYKYSHVTVEEAIRAAVNSAFSY